MDHIAKVIAEPETEEFYRAEGLEDYDADAVAISLGDWPGAVWPGWIEAGLDE